MKTLSSGYQLAALPTRAQENEGSRFCSPRAADPGDVGRFQRPRARLSADADAKEIKWSVEVGFTGQWETLAVARGA
jgi:hypothetical protein